MKNKIYKVPGGKLLRVQFETVDNVIKSIRITGDFFIHPEEAILDIEAFLLGQEVDSVSMALSEFLVRNNIIIIGFKPEDIFKIISDDNLL